MSDLAMPPDPDDRASDGFAAWLEELAAAGEEDMLFEILARLRPPRSRLARQQLRGRLIVVLRERSQALGSAFSPARTADAWLQEEGEADGLQGSQFVADEVTPWDAGVDGEEVLDEVYALFDGYLWASDEALVALTLWVAYTHLFDCFGVSPLLQIWSPTRRWGKSTAVIVMRRLCRAGLLSGNITPAALFRAVEAWKPTLLIDEADTFARMNNELRGS